MADLTSITDAQLAAEMQRRAQQAKIERFAPMRATYEPWRGFMDNEEPKTLSQLIAMAAAPRQEASDQSMELNLGVCRRVLASMKTVWDNSIGLAFDTDEEVEGAGLPPD